MTVRERKRWMRMAALAAGVGALAVLAAGLLVPVEVAQGLAAGGAGAPGSNAAPAENREADGSGQRDLVLAELERLSRTDLRRPLYDEPEPPSTAPARAVVGIRLVGTIIEPGRSLAMFQKADGSIELCAPGQSFTDAGKRVVVKRVEPDKATVEYGGAEREFSIAPGPEQGG